MDHILHSQCSPAFRKNPEPLSWYEFGICLEASICQAVPLGHSCWEDGFWHFPSTSDLETNPTGMTFSGGWQVQPMNVDYWSTDLLGRASISRILFMNSTSSHSFTWLHWAYISTLFLAIDESIDESICKSYAAMPLWPCVVRTCLASWRISPRSRWRVSGKSGPSSMAGTVYGKWTTVQNMQEKIGIPYGIPYGIPCKYHANISKSSGI